MSTNADAGLAFEPLVSQALPVQIIYMQSFGCECGMCGKYTEDRWAVPWYEEPVRSGHSEGGFQAVCKSCYDKWDAWDSSFSG